MRKKNIWKKVAGIAMAAIIAGSTNMGGLQDCVNVYASDKSVVDGVYTIDEVQWNVHKNTTTGKVELQLFSPFTVVGKDIVVPSNVEGIDIDVFTDGCGFQAKSITIPNGVEVQSNALDGCSVDTLYYKGERCTGECVPETCKNIVFDGTKNVSLGERAASVESIVCKNTPGVYFGYKGVANAKKLKSIVIEDSINKAGFYSNSFASCISLEQLEVHSKTVVFEQAAFANCVNLKHATFDGFVIFHASQRYCEDDEVVSINQGGPFYNCFQKEYDAEGNLVKKTITFHGNMCAVVEEEAPDCRTRVLEHCSGLTDVIFEKNADIYAEEFFYDCENLSHVTFKGTTMFGSGIFKKLPVLKSIEFEGNVRGMSNEVSPFDGCLADTLLFKNTVEEMYISGMDHLTTIYFGGKYAGLYNTNQGRWKRNLTLEKCDKLERIIFDLTPEALAKWKEKGNIEYAINIQDNLAHPYSIYGLNYNKTVDNYVEFWAKQYSKGTFCNIIQTVRTYYDGQVLGENLTDKDIDISKIVVKATVEHRAAQFLKMAGYDKYGFHSGEEELTVPLSKEGENNGYEMEQLPTTLVEGDNEYKVKFSGILASGIIRAENKTAVDLKVQWNQSAIDGLVENQPVTAADVVSGATIFYDNGTSKDVGASDLILNASSFSEGENVITVSLKENPNVSEQQTILVQENCMVSMIATYEGKQTLYVGDTIDVNLIKLTPVYKYDEDSTVDRQIDFTNVSSRVLSKAGENILQVYCGDFATNLSIYAEEVVPVKIYASFDSSNHAYADGQELDPKSVAVIVEYNNGIRKNGEEIGYAYTVNEKVRTKDEMTATVTYEGVESEGFSIPVMPREVSHIKVTSSIVSATEGTRIVPTAITGIEVFYNNGKSDVLDASTIDYENLTFSDYEIVANAVNTITVNYFGKSDTITVFGISNTITSIYAEYKGNGARAGSTLTTEDVAVYAVNSNGRITELTQGILLENATIYTVGENIVTIHYGAFSCIITVMGLPMETNSNETVTEPAEPQKMDTPLPSTSAPVENHEAVEVTEKKETESSSSNQIVVVSTPDLAGSAVVVSSSSVKVQANVKNIQLSEKVNYKIYTNKSVTLTITPENATNLCYQVVKKNGKVQDDQWVAVNKQTITLKKTKKPSMIYLKYTDGAGVTKIVHTNGFFIDKTKATVNVKAGKTYKKGYKLMFKDASGIKSATLDGKKVKSGVKVKKKGSHRIIVTDKAGNKKKVVFKVK